MDLGKQKIIAEYATEVFNSRDYDLQKLEIRRAVYVASRTFCFIEKEEIIPINPKKGIYIDLKFVADDIAPEDGQTFIFEYACAASGDSLDTILRVKNKLDSLSNTPYRRRQLEHYLLSL